MNIKDFINELAAVDIDGVCKRFAGMPKILRPEDLPAQYTEMPEAFINPTQSVNNFGTFDAAAAQYTGMMYIAVSRFDEGWPDEQRDEVLDFAVRVEEWAIRTPYITRIRTDLPVVVAGIQYRGITARVEAPDMA